MPIMLLKIILITIIIILKYVSVVADFFWVIEIFLTLFLLIKNVIINRKD